MYSKNIQEVISILSGLSKPAIRFWPATLVSWLIGFVLLGSLDLAVAGAEPDRKPGSQPTVVILNSYHPGEDWTDNELAGLVPTLRRAYPDFVPVIEYLDAKRFPDPHYLDLLKDHLVRKYQGYRVDLLIVLDNSALDLILKYRRDLFPSVPLIFAGINGFRPEWRQDRERMTGVAETQDMAGTLELAMRLHPGTKNVLVVHDYTASGLAVRREVEAILPTFRNRVKVTFSADVPFAELERQLQALPRDTVVLLPTYVTDRDGRVFSGKKARGASPPPVPRRCTPCTKLGWATASWAVYYWRAGSTARRRANWRCGCWPGKTRRKFLWKPAAPIPSSTTCNCAASKSIRRPYPLIASLPTVRSLSTRSIGARYGPRWL